MSLTGMVTAGWCRTSVATGAVEIVAERVSARHEMDALLVEDRGTDVGLMLAGHASALRAEVQRHVAKHMPDGRTTFRTYWITYEEIVE
jgi:hypothetical protein